MSTGQNIVVVDDEAATREMVGDYLAMHGFSVTLCDGGDALRSAVGSALPALVVLDLNMPGEDGLSLVRFLRQRGQVPIIMLTATASAIDRVVGLELGADDYVAKPCELRELLARVRSVLRRSSSQDGAESGQPRAGSVRMGTKWLDLDARLLRDEDGIEHPLTASEFSLLKAFAENPKRVLTRERRLDLDSRLLRDEDGIEHPLTASEFSLLKAFAENPKRVLTRERLLDLAQARDAEAFDRAIDVRITRIRKKIEPDPARPQIIRTVRGAGYVFSPEAAHG